MSSRTETERRTQNAEHKPTHTQTHRPTNVEELEQYLSIGKQEMGGGERKEKQYKDFEGGDGGGISLNTSPEIMYLCWGGDYYPQESGVWGVCVQIGKRILVIQNYFDGHRKTDIEDKKKKKTLITSWNFASS